jgi:hypothetical protein
MDVSEGSKDNGALLHVWDCTGVANKIGRIRHLQNNWEIKTVEHVWTWRVATRIRRQMHIGHVMNKTKIKKWEVVDKTTLRPRPTNVWI